MIHPKKKYKTLRKEFKQELAPLLKENAPVCSLLFATSVAKRMRNHIHKIWALLGYHHRDAYQDYCEMLKGEMICGRESVWNALFHVSPEFCQKWSRKLPEAYAFGDALAIANRYRIKEYVY